MIVKGLYVYPIKGIRGVAVSEAVIEKNGLQHDRRYMLTNLEGQFLSQRNHPALTQVTAMRSKDSWTIRYKDEKLVIADDILSSEQYEVEVWGDRFLANEVSAIASEWFTHQLGIKCRLVAMPQKDSRIKEFDKEPYQTSISFADGYPILTLGTASLDLLNSKLDSSIPADRFRANILVHTSEAHEEDTWSDFKIGEQVVCRNIKPCVRCQVITIDQNSGISGKEPTQTLASYRKIDKGICFGSNVIVLAEGKIKLGDRLVLSS